MIVDLPQFRSDLQKHRVENAKDGHQTKSQNVTKDGKLEAEKKAALESMISEANKSWCQPGFKPPGSGGEAGFKPPGSGGEAGFKPPGSGGEAGEEGIVGILEPGATRPPVFNSSAMESDSKLTQSLPGKSPPQECQAPPADRRESSSGGWPGQCTSKVVGSITSNFQVATLADFFTRELPETANCSQVEIN